MIGRFAWNRPFRWQFPFVRTHPRDACLSITGRAARQLASEPNARRHAEAEARHQAEHERVLETARQIRTETNQLPDPRLASTKGGKHGTSGQRSG